MTTAKESCRHAGELDRLYKQTGQPDDDALVFPDPISGEPLDKAANLRRYRKLLKSASLDSTHNLHGLRHTMGTRMAGAGVPMRTLQEWMGHRNLSTTERYADYAPSVHESAMIEKAWAPQTHEHGNHGGPCMSLPRDVIEAKLALEGYEYVGPATSGEDKPPPGEDWTVVGFNDETSDEPVRVRRKS